MVTWKQTYTAEPVPHDRAAFAAARSLPARAASRDPLITMRREAWQDLLAHVRSERVEVGGMLLGEVFGDERGRISLDILHAIPALGARQEPTYYKLTDEAWAHICATRDAIDPDMLIVGWYHSHPGLGVFFSGTDRASQRAFYNRPWNLGLVIDPATDDVALFLGGESERISRDHLVICDDLALPVFPPDPPQPGAPAGPPAAAWRVDRQALAACLLLGLLSAALLRRVWRARR
ncbi:MAG: Mov34/MPN/PAD-1 family protein [Chloroflexota bacterium]